MSLAACLSPLVAPLPSQTPLQDRINGGLIYGALCDPGPHFTKLSCFYSLQCSFPDSQQQQRPFPTTTGSSLVPRLSATRAAELDGCQPPGPGYCAQTGMFCPRMASWRSISKQGSGGEIFIKQGAGWHTSHHSPRV